MTAELAVRRPPVVRFSGGPNAYRLRRLGVPEPAVAYRVPRNTLDPRYRTCTDHHVACDCREAELDEQLEEHRIEWKALRDAARRALIGHQVDYPMGLSDLERLGFPLCLCPGCVIERETRNLLSFSDVDHRTGRVLTPSFGWGADEVPF